MPSAQCPVPSDLFEHRGAMNSKAHGPVSSPLDVRVAWLAGLGILLGITAGGVAWVLARLIGLVTIIFFFARLSTEWVTPTGHGIGPWVIVVPVVGGVIVGIMARYGSPAIRGH